MKRSLAAAALTGTFLVATPAPAHAGNMILTHAPDDGYDAPFAVRCVNGANERIDEGWNSGQICGGVTQVYVNSGAKLVCYWSGIGWKTWKDATGWHDTGGSNAWCVYQLD